MTPDDRKKLRELAMAALVNAPPPWKAYGATLYAADDTSSRVVCNLDGGVDKAVDLAAYIAAAHPGAIIELLDDLETAKRDRDAKFKVLAHYQVKRFPVVNEYLRKSETGE